MAHDGEEDFGLDQFEAAFTDLRAVVVRPAAPEVAADHLARMQVTSGGSVAATAAASSLARTRHAESFWTMPRKVAAAVAAVAVGLFGLGGLGMAGALPGPVQDFVATVTDPLGLDLPRSDRPRPRRQGQGHGHGEWQRAWSGVRRHASPRPERLDSGSVRRDPRQRRRASWAERLDARSVGRQPVGHCAGSVGREPVGHRTRTSRQPLGDCPRAVRQRSRPVRERWRERQWERERRRQWERQRGHGSRPQLTAGSRPASRHST